MGDVFASDCEKCNVIDRLLHHEKLGEDVLRCLLRPRKQLLSVSALTSGQQLHTFVQKAIISGSCDNHWYMLLRYTKLSVSHVLSFEF